MTLVPTEQFLPFLPNIKTWEQNEGPDTHAHIEQSQQQQRQQMIVVMLSSSLKKIAFRLILPKHSPRVNLQQQQRRTA